MKGLWALGTKSHKSLFYTCLLSTYFSIPREVPQRKIEKASRKQEGKGQEAHPPQPLSNWTPSAKPCPASWSITVTEILVQMFNIFHGFVKHGAIKKHSWRFREWFISHVPDTKCLGSLSRFLTRHLGVAPSCQIHSPDTAGYRLQETEFCCQATVIFHLDCISIQVL